MRLVRGWTIATACVLSACGGGGGGSGGGSATDAHVAVTATGPSGRVAKGSAVVLDVTVTNTGTQTASNVVATFFAYAGAGLTGIDCSATGGAVCPFASQQFATSMGLLAEGFHTTVPTLPPQGSLHFRLSELVDATESGPLTTRLSVTADGQTPGVDSQVDFVVNAYVVQLVASGGVLTPTVAPGGTATYVMSLSNAGPDPALNVIVTNDVGPHQTLVSTTCVAAGSAACPAIASNGATMTVPTIPAGGSVTLTMTAAVAADAPGLVSNVFSARDPGDRYPGDNVRVATTAVATSFGGTFLTLRSDPGESLGRGAAYAYTQADAVFFVSASGNYLTIGVRGNEWWSGAIGFPAATGIRPGTYVFASPPVAATEGSFTWWGTSAYCESERTQIVVDSVAYSGATLSAIDLRFDHTCNGASAVLHGQLHWAAADATPPSGPENPPPPALWRAPAGSTPPSGNYIYLASDAGEPLVGGQTLLLTQANAIVGIVSGVPGQLTLDVKADANVYARFRGSDAQTQLRPGYYGPLQTPPDMNPAIGAMDWTEGSIGCPMSGWFVVDDVGYAGTDIVSIDARFEQHCDGALPALRGQIHWAPGDPTVPPGPVSPPPAELWSPPAGATPAAGNYIYLQSDPGDFVGGGGTYLFTPATSTIAATATDADLKIVAGPGAGFDGEFVGMNTIAQLQPGYYAGLHRFPFNNPTRGGMDVNAFDSGCNLLSGWFVVDSVAYSGGTLTSIDLRFEQHCENAVPALHGKIHWSNG
jgi:uncharacterized repeat protein (TIGR01451 family)